MGYRIAQAAERSGVPATTIRYYEDQGTIRPADRAANGYRVYDDRDIARLRFVNRARTLDLAPDDLAELVDLWEHDRCAPVAQRLRDQVADRLADIQQRVANLTALAGDLQRVLARLEQPAHDGPCIEGQCVCLDTTSVTRTATDLPVIGNSHRGEARMCTLDPDRMPDRLGDWQRLLARVVARRPIADGVSLDFPADPNVAAEITALTAAEQDCCSFFDFTLHFTGQTVRLHVTAPPDAQPMVAALFGTPGSADADTQELV